VKDLRALAKEPVQISLNEPITSIHVFPSLVRYSLRRIQSLIILLIFQARPPRASLVLPSSNSTTRRSPLGEARNGTNAEVPVLPLPAPILKDKEVVRSESDEKRKVVRTEINPKAPAASAQGTRRVILPFQPAQFRAVSEPQASSRPRPPASGSSRVTSNPGVTPSTSRPSSARGMTPAPAPIVEEDEDEGEKHEMDETAEGDGVHLSWALHPPSTPPFPTGGATPRCEGQGQRGECGVDWATVDELRREIGNLQLDMLRMGRGLKVSQFPGFT
jgi:hypothetical protein